MIVEQTYWDSTEAIRLFLGSASDYRNAVEVLQQRIERLQQVNWTVEGWRDLEDKNDKDNLCSAYDIFIIRQRSSILCLAYTMALEEMNLARWVEDCCTQAIFDSSKMGSKLLVLMNGLSRVGIYFWGRSVSVFRIRTQTFTRRRNLFQIY